MRQPSPPRKSRYPALITKRSRRSPMVIELLWAANAARTENILFGSLQSELEERSRVAVAFVSLESELEAGRLAGSTGSFIR
jgi:hypothetical protein